jgi:hypothetical protein
VKGEGFDVKFAVGWESWDNKKMDLDAGCVIYNRLGNNLYCSEVVNWETNSRIKDCFKDCFKK